MPQYDGYVSHVINKTKKKKIRLHNKKKKNIKHDNLRNVDNTICDTPPSADYTKAKPIYERIAKINSLYDQGHTIVCWTARGTRTGTDWRELTEQQLSKWLVKYHELKPTNQCSLFIDDATLIQRGTSMADARKKWTK